MNTVIESGDASFNQYWSQLFDNDPIQNPLYDKSNSNYYDSYYAELGCSDRSFLVVAEDEPVFACSLTSHTDKEGRKCMGYFGLAASTHINRKSMENSQNNFSPDAIKMLRQHMSHLIDTGEPDRFSYIDPVSCGVLSPITQILLEKGAEPAVHGAQVLDLTLSEQGLRRGLRKSYRNFINWGARNLELEVLDSRNFELKHLEEFYSLHLQSAESEPLSRSGWYAHESMIRNDHAFLVRGHHNGVLVSCALFVHTSKTCHFAVSAARNDLFDKPLAHSLIWQAILHSKTLGCERFELGEQLYSDLETGDIQLQSGDKPSVSKFKQGFGGETQQRLKVSLELSNSF